VWASSVCIRRCLISLANIWSEQIIHTHDLAIPLPPRKEVFRLILMSSAELQHPGNHMDRIERLYHQTGGQHVGIIFLIQDTGSKEISMRSFMTLQAKLVCILKFYMDWSITADAHKSTSILRDTHHSNIFGFLSTGHLIWIPKTTSGSS